MYNKLKKITMWLVTKDFISGHLIYALKVKKHLITGITGKFINYIDK